LGIVGRQTQEWLAIHTQVSEKWPIAAIAVESAVKSSFVLKGIPYFNTVRYWVECGLLRTHSKKQTLRPPLRRKRCAYQLPIAVSKTKGYFDFTIF